jgi:abortive infection Abi-like protein
MEPVKSIIVANADQHPDFRYYLPLLAKAQRNETAHPDICIECCKSLLEGVSKTIIYKLDGSVDRKDLDAASWNLDGIVKKAAIALKQNDDIVEDNFVTRFGSLINALGALRNERGDISHGRSAPKHPASPKDLSRLILDMTASLLEYLLSSFYAIAPEEVEEDVSEDSDLEDISYNENLEFNDFLDAQNPLEGKLLYSFALYELYYEDYLLRLDAYKESPEE